MNFDVVIIGGGLSGLAAAVKLSSEGIHVAVVERAPRLGGRCYSYIDRKTGDVVDNGQHILLGAYHYLRQYLDLIGTSRFLRSDPSLGMTFHHQEKGRVKFEMPPFPKPLHLTAGMLKFKLLPFGDRQRLLKVGFTLARWNDKLEKKLSSLSVGQWLNQLNQSDEAIKCFWSPIAVSAMNEYPEKASALLFARALRETFFGKKSDSVFLIPTVGQTELYVDNALKILDRRRAGVYLNTEVEKIEVNGDKIEGVLLRYGISIRAKYVIATVMPHSLRKLIPAKFKNTEPFVNLDKFETSPIISLNLWFDKEFMDIGYMGLIGKDLQWIFNRRRLMNEKKETSYLTCVISAAHQYVDFPKDKLCKYALRDINKSMPESRKARLLHSVIIKEKRATISATKSVEVFRPDTETPIENFYLAGDWTNTGLPATIESAVRSGFKAVRLIE